jgi:hypothetical protein
MMRSHVEVVGIQNQVLIFIRHHAGIFGSRL